MDMENSDDDGIPPLHEALRMSSRGTSSRSRMINEDVQDLRETARTWIEEDNRLSARKKDKLTRAARLGEISLGSAPPFGLSETDIVPVELQSRRRKPLVSPSPSPSPAPASPLIRARARDSSVGMVDTSDSVTQPTTPYDAPQQRHYNQRPGWSRSPVLSPVVNTAGLQDELWTRHETPDFPKDGFYEHPREEQDDGKGERTSTAAAKGKGRATLADLFIDDEAEEEETYRRLSPATSMQGMVMDGDDHQGAVEDEIDELDDDQFDELAEDIPAGEEHNIEAGGDGGESDEYDDEDLDYALADLDPDSFSPSAPGPSRPKAVGSIDHNMDHDADFVEPLDAGVAHPPTQYDITGVDFFTDDYDLPLLAPHSDDDDDDDTADSGGIVSPIVLIHEMEEKYQEFFNEHWRRGADGAKRQYNQPDAEGSGSRTSGTKGKARAGAGTGAARKKFWATRGRGRGRGRGRARGGARRK